MATRSPITMTPARERGLRAVRAKADLALSSSDDSEMSDEEAKDIARGLQWIDAYLRIYERRVITMDSITDEQILELRKAGKIGDGTYRGALLDKSQHGSLGLRVRRNARKACADAWNEMIRGNEKEST